MNYSRFVIIVLFVVFLGIVFAASMVVYIDPYFHYHKPNPEFYYNLKSQRYQNDGILKHFDYDAIITGTSMTENFKSSEFDSLYSVNSIKVSYSGGSFKEINDAINVAYKSGHRIKTVVRTLESYKIIADKDAMRTDLGSYPEYLYNDNYFDDVKYVLNRDVLIKHCLPMMKNKLKGKMGGITSFDKYSNWNSRYKFGRKFVLKKEYNVNLDKKQKDFTDIDRKMVVENIQQNITSLAEKHPETTFYYFFPPFSIVYYGNLINKGELERTLHAEKLTVEMILECPNIKLFSFDLMTDIATNLDNYKDTYHYGEWINSDILRYMKNNIGLLSKDNYEEFFERKKDLYLKYPYGSI